MDEFDFTTIVANIDKANEYRKNNYYTNFYKKPLDEYDYTKEVIEVEDWSGLKGKMTLGDFSKYIGSRPEDVAANVRKHLRGEPMNKCLVRKFRENFKKITFGEDCL